MVVITDLRVLRDASLELLDTMPEPELTGEIVKISRSVTGVLGIDKVFARKNRLAVSHRSAHRSRSGTGDRHIARDRGTYERPSSASCRGLPTSWFTWNRQTTQNATLALSAINCVVVEILGSAYRSTRRLVLRITIEAQQLSGRDEGRP